MSFISCPWVENHVHSQTFFMFSLYFVQNMKMTCKISGSRHAASQLCFLEEFPGQCQSRSASGHKKSRRLLWLERVMTVRGSQQSEMCQREQENALCLDDSWWASLTKAIMTGQMMPFAGHRWWRQITDIEDMLSVIQPATSSGLSLLSDPSFNFSIKH